MSDNTKKLIILVIVLLLLSGIMSCLVSGTVRFVFWGGKNSDDVSKTYQVKGSFNSISVETNVSKIQVLPARDGKASVVRTGSGKRAFTVNTSGKKLTVSEKETRLWFLRFGSYTGKSEIIVYLPEKTYSSLKIETDTGSITVDSGFAFEHMDIKSDTGAISLSSVNVTDGLDVKTDTGKVTLIDMYCEDLSVKTSTGNIDLRNVLTSETLKIKSDTGNVSLEKCDAADIEIKTDTGRVNGTLLSGKEFEVRSDLGKISVPESVPGGKCKIETDTGSITIEITPR